MYSLRCVLAACLHQNAHTMDCNRAATVKPLICEVGKWWTALWRRGPAGGHRHVNIHEMRSSLADCVAPCRSSHTPRICKDFNNEPLTANQEDRSGVNKPLYICKCTPYKSFQDAACRLSLPPTFAGFNTSLKTKQRIAMVKYFSVDWLVQRSKDLGGSACKPHIPCMVQPRQPAYGKSYLQPKPKPVKSHPAVDFCNMSLPTRCSSPISETSGYSSGYDSEAASSECQSLDEACEADKDGPQQRRVRTKFTPEQINKLIKMFDKHKYLDAGERVKIAHKLGLTETQVRTWFQNRRMKLKRDVQDFSPQVTPVMFRHLPPGHYRPMAAQHHNYHPGPGAFYSAAPRMLLQQQVMIHNPQFY
ncbi:homeobox protein vent1-like isoform X2 [Nerophis lumbriciformis]|uniref:homeobox protein vent1-like isoform X2 n=1 Tax=Nerophis lumbriciformis TaxID=546530 RepID=UPI002ADFB9B2|nr:homeobox protein vent1-like isoform X2 [Nerophis lumbriciformis]